ncbi:VWA domain-containing protein [Streptomyces arboris]|uniref:VWA domain-containing protein n=1 Tax=Streptomyces arboris TaxID=2600619 RepID=A0A5N5EU64_9ACTN|nr:VWA domain-containing protein [Streptomyces arboris]KAB2592282.1 VWA domain-containing protein [Streptomyces arboris]
MGATPGSGLDELTGRAATWLGLATATPERHTGVVVADRFERITWRDTYEQSAGLRELAEELAGLHEHATDLLNDVFLAAYKVGLRLREPTEMDPSRLVNHQVISSLVESPDFAGLRRETVGDPYAAALAVLAQCAALRRLLGRSRDAQDQGERAARARQDAEDAADAVAEALRQAAAAADEDGTVPATAADAVHRAVETAEATGSAARRAAQAVREEAALMRAWGVGSGELERMPFDRRARLAERLRTGRLAERAELIGRFRQMADGERARKVENAAGELMLYDSQGEQPTGRGAVIACVDTSHSMYAAGPGGVTREAWAKACALALLDQARDAGRDFVGILFSAADKVQVFRFPAGRSAGIGQVLDFAETFLGGGTSYQAPLTAARELLEEESGGAAAPRADIVMITDDECGVTEEWMRGWNEARHRLGFRVFGVAVGAPRAAEAGSVLDALCDNLRSVEDFTDVHAAADLFRLI